MRLRRALHNSPSSSLQLFDKLVAFNPREQSQAAALPLLELAASHSGNKGELLKAMAVCHILNRQYGLQQPPHKTPKDLAGTLRVLVGGEERWNELLPQPARNAPIHFWRLGARALSSKAEFDTLAASKTQLAFILRLFSDADGEEKWLRNTPRGRCSVSSSRGPPTATRRRPRRRCPPRRSCGLPTFPP